MRRRGHVYLLTVIVAAIVAGCGTQNAAASSAASGAGAAVAAEQVGLAASAGDTAPAEGETGTTLDMKLYSGDVLPILTMLSYLMNNDMTSTRIEAGYNASIGSDTGRNLFWIRAAFAEFESPIKDAPYQEFKGGYALVKSEWKTYFEIGTGTLESAMEERQMLATVIGIEIPIKAGGYGFATDISWEYNHDENQFGSSVSDNKFRIGFDFPIAQVVTLGLIYGRIETNNSDYAMDQLAFKAKWNIWKTLSMNLLVERYEGTDGADWENHGVLSIQYVFARGITTGLEFLSVKQDGADGTAAVGIFGGYKF